MANLGTNIKKFRMQKNMTQDELAEKLFVSRQTISNYENNKSQPDIEMLAKIAETFETDVNALLRGEEWKNDNKQKVRKYLVRVTFLLLAAIVLALLQKEVVNGARGFRDQKIFFGSLKNMGMGDRIEIFYMLYYLNAQIVIPSFCMYFGYHVIEGVFLLWQKEYIEGKYLGLCHRMIQIVIGMYYIILLPFFVHYAIEQIDYWRWRITSGVGGWSSSAFSFLPIWDEIMLQIYLFEDMHFEMTVVICLFIGALLRITKKKKIRE